jgi:thioesterase domain-containing protein
VAIQPNGTKRPFFCVHAIWGNVFHYRELAQRLGPDQPFYGLQAQGLDGKCPPYETVEEMAANYIQELREFQPKGPYYLGGHSFGGLVAFEMARQLHSRGQRVDLLALFDTSSSPLSPGPTRLEFVRDRTRFHMATLKGIPPKQKARYLLRRAQTLVRLVALSLSSAYQRIFRPLRSARRRVYEANRRAALKYVPGFYAGRLTILWAAERWKRLGTDRLLRGPQLGWGRLCGDGVEVHEVPGDHASMLEDEANIQVVAEKLSDCLRDAQEKELRRSGWSEPVAGSVGTR